MQKQELISKFDNSKCQFTQNF